MKIVVLDGYTLNPGDQSWHALEALGDCTIHDRTGPKEIVTRAIEAELLLTNKVPLTREVISQLPKLKYIGVLATGFNIVDVAAARERKIPVTNVPTYGTRSVAQLTLALILELAHRVGAHADSVKAGEWASCPDFSYWRGPLIELDGLTLGIVGFGRIGRAVAQLGQAFGMRVIATSRSPIQRDCNGVVQVSLEELFSESDIISLHCPLTEETRNLVNRERLALVKKHAWLINTSRGPLVDESALAAALNRGDIAAAALDVLSTEPPPVSNPLLSAKNCWVTPHIAWASVAARRRLLETAIENLKAFLSGSPRNVVNL